MMQGILHLIFMVAILCFGTAQAHAQGAGIEWETFIQEATELGRAGRYAQAVKVAEAELAVAEENVGPNHRDVATSLINLAWLYHNLGNYAKAEPLYKRSPAISEKTLGAEHPDVVVSLKNLAKLYRTMNRSAEAENLEGLAITAEMVKR